MAMTSHYPNPYEASDFGGYQDPYSQTDTYNNPAPPGTEHTSYDDAVYGNGFNNDAQVDSYEGYNSRAADQDERDRQQRRNRSERRRELRRDDRDTGMTDRADRDMRNTDRDYDTRDRDSTRDRERDSSRNRDRYRDRDERVDRLSYGEREREFERRDREQDERAGEKWISETPTNTIILRNLPQCIEEKDIKAELMLFGAPIKDVRLMRKSSGASRGFAFVEFQNNADAQRWMDTNQHTLRLQNLYNSTMHFSTPKDPKDKQMFLHKMDWTCIKCGVHNFKRRDYCFKCNMSRYESGKQQADGYDHVGTNPCNTLLFRGLDALTTEENLLRALNGVTEMTCKNIQVIRDATTNISAGFAFIELSSVAESMNVLDMVKALSLAFEVDGKQIIVSFAKNTFTTSIATISAAATQSWDQTSTEYYAGYDYTQSGYDTTGAYYSGGQYSDGQSQYDYSEYYGTDTTTSTTNTSTTAHNTEVDSTNAAAAVAQAAIQQALAAKNFQKQAHQKISDMSTEERLAHQAQEWTQNIQQHDQPAADMTKYPTPDVSLYQFDESSGYYYDPITTLYYDANSQYYYNGNTGQFLYWDAEHSTYLPAPTGHEDQNGNKEDRKEGKEKKEKVKVAKKIAKDMEKWAKSMNAQKEALKDGMKKINLPNLSGRKESATADAGFAILEKVAKGVTPEDKKLMPPPPMPGSTTPSDPEKSKLGLVASYGGDSDEEDDDSSPPGGGEVDETKLLDLTKMACLLCKRQFNNKDQLMRHTQMSDLHKQNLEKIRQNSSSGSNSNSGQYRDRAKERREKIGSVAPPARKRPPPPPEVYEQPTKAGIGEDNIGSKMLQKMGWSSGQGLGKTGQGIVDPIKAERRNMSAGLGMRGSNYNIEDTDNYKEALKKTMFARYNEHD